MGSVVQNESFNVSQLPHRAMNLIVRHILPNTLGHETLNGVKGARCDEGEVLTEGRREVEAVEWAFDTGFSILKVQRKQDGYLQDGKYQFV